MIHVCSLRAAQEQISLHGIRRVVSILSPETPHRRFDGVVDQNHLQLTFNDIAMATEGMTTPGASDVETLLRFVKDWDRTTPMLFHCWAGVSRSTAGAFITQLVLAQALRHASPSATPNRMMVSFADHLLAREGQMNEAVAAIGRGVDAYEGTPFRWEF
jgi:predicted protein tyrosine phosphatase